jgi:hypothetical protein
VEGGEKVAVRKIMFLNIVGVTKKFVRVALKKKLDSGLVSTDDRGKHTPSNKFPEETKQSVVSHIKCFPCYESHYSRENTAWQYLGSELSLATMYRLYLENCRQEKIAAKYIAKECFYQKIFNEIFNLGFKGSSADTCDDCDSLLMQLKEVTSEEEKKKIDEKLKLHQEDAANCYHIKRQDKDLEKSTRTKKNDVMMDLQKCLPAPGLTNGQSFYLRKLWTLNLTIHNDTMGTLHCILWNETLGGSGNEISSCFIKWALDHVDPGTKELIVWSDSFPGQNRNTLIVSACMWLFCEKKSLEIINHKYLLKGHTHTWRPVMFMV